MQAYTHTHKNSNEKIVKKLLLVQWQKQVPASQKHAKFSSFSGSLVPGLAGTGLCMQNEGSK